MGETSQRKIRTNSEGSSKVETLSIVDVAQKFLRYWAAKVICNLQPGECPVLAATKKEGPTMYLVHSTRCSQELTHAGNIPLQLLQCTSCQGQVLQSTGAWWLIFFTKVLPVERSLEISIKAFWGMCAIEEKVLLLWNHSIFSVSNRYLAMWYPGNDWLAWLISEISLSAVVIRRGWRRKMFFRYTPYLNHSCCCRSIDLAMGETSESKRR